jgi:hypothetical protein
MYSYASQMQAPMLHIFHVLALIDEFFMLDKFGDQHVEMMSTRDEHTFFSRVELAIIWPLR